jgi:hypothetical protein
MFGMSAAPIFFFIPFIMHLLWDTPQFAVCSLLSGILSDVHSSPGLKAWGGMVVF